MHNKIAPACEVVSFLRGILTIWTCCITSNLSLGAFGTSTEHVWDARYRHSSFRGLAVLHDGILVSPRLHQLVSTNHCQIQGCCVDLQRTVQGSRLYVGSLKLWGRQPLAADRLTIM